MFSIRIKPEILQLATKLRHKYKMQNDQTISNKYSDDNSISVASEMNTINYTFAGSWRGLMGPENMMAHYISILQVGKLFMNNTRAGVGSDGVGPNAFQSDNLA